MAVPCAIGGGLINYSNSDCYTDEKRGLNDISVCPACLYNHVKQYYGEESPICRHLAHLHIGKLPKCVGGVQDIEREAPVERNFTSRTREKPKDKEALASRLQEKLNG